LFGEDHEETANSYSCFGILHKHLGNFKKELEFHLKCYNIRIKKYGERHPDTIATINNLGNAYIDNKINDKAIEYHEKALQLRISMFGNNMNTSGSYTNIGIIYFHLNNYEKTLENYNMSLNIKLNCLGKYHHQTGVLYYNISLVHMKTKNYVQSLINLEESLKILSKILNSENKDLKNTKLCLTQVYKLLGISFKKDEYSILKEN